MAKTDRRPDQDEPLVPARVAPLGYLLRLPAGLMMLVLTAIVLTCLTVSGLNGSSISLLRTTPGHDSSLVLGVPRGIRGDEALLSTPTMVGNARRGLPVQPQIGLVRTYLPAIGNLAPSAHWSTLFRPSDWGWFILPASAAFAFRWWLPLVASLIGLAWLLSRLGASRPVSMWLAVAGTATPAVAWWSLVPAAVVGYGSLAAAALLAGLAAERLTRRLLCSLTAGYWITAFALLLYPPWQISVAWILGAVVLGVGLDDRTPWRRFVGVVGPSLTVSGIVLFLWYEGAKQAIAATAATIYPGHRLAGSGEGVAAWLLSAPSSFWATYNRGSAISGFGSNSLGRSVGGNLSEVSSVWLPVPVIAVLTVATLILARRRRSLSTPPTSIDAASARPIRYWTTWLVAAATLLMAAWALVPGLGLLGRLTLLDRVPGVRVDVALGVGVLVLLTLASIELAGCLSRNWIVVLAAAALGSAWLTLLATHRIPWTRAAAPTSGALLLVSLTLAALWATTAAYRPAASAAGIAVFACAAVVGVNPLYHGLGPLDHDPVVNLLRPIVSNSGPRLAVLGPLSVSALAESTGAQVLSGLTYYPDRALWRRLDPGQPDWWNNYAKYVWRYDATASPVRIAADKGTMKYLDVDLCAPRVRELGLQLILSVAPVSAPCLSLQSVTPGPKTTFYLYADSNR